MNKFVIRVHVFNFKHYNTRTLNILSRSTLLSERFVYFGETSRDARAFFPTVARDQSVSSTQT